MSQPAEVVQFQTALWREALAHCRTFQFDTAFPRRQPVVVLIMCEMKFFKRNPLAWVAGFILFSAAVLLNGAESKLVQPGSPTSTTASIASTPATLIFDQRSETADLRNFRTCCDLPGNTNGGINPTGLVSLGASGSSTFDSRGLNSILQRISSVRTQAGGKTGPVTIIDLRQESHGYINGGVPISWMGERDWANKDLSDEQVLALETRLLDRVRTDGNALISDEANYKAGNPNPRPVTVTNLLTEKQLVEQAGVRYVRLMVTDHLRPTDAEVDRFITTVRNLPEDGWVHFHCHAGRGRTTMFLVLWDILHNAGQVSLADITKRQSELAGGDIELLSVTKNLDWQRAAAQDRKDFLTQFYEYAKTKPLQTNAPSWSEWLKTQNSH